MATAKELRELTVEDLNRRALEIREQLFQDLLKLKTGSLDKPTERTKHRRDLARVLTVLTEKQPRRRSPRRRRRSDFMAETTETAEAGDPRPSEDPRRGSSPRTRCRRPWW